MMFNSKRIGIIAGVTLVVTAIIIVVVILVPLSSQNSSNSIQNKVGGSKQDATEHDHDHGPKSAYKKFRYAAAATDADVCSNIAVDIMARLSGSAVDAAIAGMLCVGVVSRHSTGIGGGHFMTIYERPRNGASDEKEMKTIMAREMAPSRADSEMYVNNTDASLTGGLAIAVPGEIAGYYEAWRRYGRIPWSDLYLPTIKLVQDGFGIGRSLAEAIKGKETIIKEDANLRQIFTDRNGKVLKEGDLMKDTKLANTLKIIAEDPRAMYSSNSQLARDIVDDIADYDGIIDIGDLTRYYAVIEDPVSITLQNGNYTVYGPQPPSSGAILQYILNILDGYMISPHDLESHSSKTLLYHRIIDSFKFAFAKRSNLGDKQFVDVEELLSNMTSSAIASHIRSKIHGGHTHSVSYYDPDFDMVEDGGTSHASFLAPDGAAVAITSTINTWFGSKVRGRRTGILFNNEMDDFSTPGTSNTYGVPASPANYIVPGKRPLSSMCPSILLDTSGNVRFISGASGGPRIITATTLVTINSIWMNMGLDKATDKARFHHQLMPDYIRFENHADKKLMDSLKKKGHKFDKPGNLARVYTIVNKCSENKLWQLEDCIEAVSDGRKGGSPDGF